MIWAKHRDLATLWCAVRSVSDGSYIAYDGGRWNIGDIDQFETVAADPPSEVRCGACVRAVGAELVSRGLKEFANAVIDFEMIDTRFDDGGEA